LVGLKDSFEVFGGTITVESPPDGGTSLVVALPLGQLHDETVAAFRHALAQGVRSPSPKTLKALAEEDLEDLGLR
jgi:hypothetical protein